MKKTLLSAAAFAVAGVSAVAIMPTTSEAIPAFARQTGAACLSCHFQTFPALTSFGRSFKLNAFTDVGEQALIEDDGLSLPSVLNAALMMRAQYQLTKKATGSVRAFNVPADSVIMVAGRVGAHTGGFAELSAGSTTKLAGNWQLMNSFDFDGLKVGLNIANTGFGPTAALELTSVYGQHSGKLWGGNVSAVNAIIGNIPQTTSVALWTGNDTFTVQGAMVAFADANGAVSPSFVPLIRGTYIADLGGAELLIGGTLISGTQSTAGTPKTPGAKGTPGSVTGIDAKWVDVQIQGEMGDASYGIYADYVTTKSKGVSGGQATNGFSLKGGDSKRDGFGIRAEVKPLHNVLFGIGYMTDKNTAAAGAATALVTKTSITHVAATYEIYQNMELNVYYDNASTTAGITPSINTKTYMIDLEALM